MFIDNVITGLYTTMRLAYQFLRKGRQNPNVGEGTRSRNMLSLALAHLKWLVFALSGLSRIRHESSVSSFLAQQRGGIFMDIGAHVGHYCWLLQNRFHRIIAIEPSSENVKILRFCARVRRANNITILPIAVSDHTGVADFFNSVYSGCNSIIPRSFSYSGSGNGQLRQKRSWVQTVPVTTLSRLITQPVDLVKVDVEGAEWLVLEGARSVMNHVRSWIIELHDMSRKQELEQWFRQCGYNTKWLDSNHNFSHMYAWR